MKLKAAIKVIKKREASDSSEPALALDNVASRQSVRDMAQTVNSWVDEFQKRRNDETRRALRTLFPAA